MYCVYLTTYSGSLFPSKYIGSSSVDKVNKGYKGSIRSKRYKDIWKTELKNNPHLFKTEIISLHETRKEALEAELAYQLKNNVVKSEEYLNQAIASVNGFFGRNVQGENNPMYGKRGENSPNFGSKRNEKTKQLMKTTHSHPCPEHQKIFLSNYYKGRKWYNNGIDQQKQFIDGEQPEGWFPGMFPMSDLARKIYQKLL